MAKSKVAELIVYKMSVDAIPSDGGLADGIAFLTSREKTVAGMQAAKKWVEEAIAVVKTAPDNPYKTDEEIAAAILEKARARK